jgi:hypothetical protein
MLRHKVVLIAVVGIAATLVGFNAFSQPPRRGPRGGGEASLAQPFRGIASGGKIEKGLFKIQSTGVSTEPVVKAAEAFLAGLSDEQRKRTTFPVDDLEWRKWDNRHFYKRQGVGFDEMDAKQRELAFGLMRASLSAKGLKLSKDIMKLNGTLAEVADNFDEYGEWLYWITIMGEPSATKPWGWQIDGHHLIINYFVLGDQVVMSPVFVGSEPVHATSGKFKGTIVLIEFDHERRVAPFRSRAPTRDHIHAVIRTPNGNDYGKDLLRQHYELHHKDGNHSH